MRHNWAILKKPNALLPSEMHKAMTNWWLAVHRGKMTTPNWDIASTCTIIGKPGLVLVEAKAHKNELDWAGKSLKNDASQGSVKNHSRIGEVISEASAELLRITNGSWGLSRDSRYQLANRFAWSWKLASLGIPIILVYLGFLDAQDMGKNRELFTCDEDWERAVREYGEGVVDNNCWGQWLNVGGTPFIPLIRTLNQPFMPQV